MIKDDIKGVTKYEVYSLGALHNGYTNIVNIDKLEKDYERLGWELRDAKLMRMLEYLELRNRGVETYKSREREYRVSLYGKGGIVVKFSKGHSDGESISRRVQPLSSKLGKVEDYLNIEVILEKYLVGDILTKMYESNVYELTLDDIDNIREGIHEGTLDIKDSYMKMFNVSGDNKLTKHSEDILEMVNLTVNKYKELDLVKEMPNSYKEDIILKGVRVGELTKTEHKDSLIEDYDKEDGGVWKIKRDMFKLAGYHKLTDVEDEVTMRRDAETAANKEITSRVVAVPNLEDNNELTLTEEGVWTTSDKVHPKHSMLVVKNGVVLYKGFDGKYQGLDINSFFGNILVRLGLCLGKKRYFRGLFETGMTTSSSEFGVGYRKKEEGKTYHLKQQDGLRYLDELKGKEFYNIERDFMEFNQQGGYLSGKRFEGEGIDESIPNLLDILNTAVELESGLVTRYYSIITLEDDKFRVEERATKLREEDRYKEYVINEKELTEDSLISWYLTLKEINERFKELKLIEDHNKKIEKEQKVYDKAREYLPEYMELYDKHKGKLSLNKIGKRLEEHSVNNEVKLEELTQDFNKLSKQVLEYNSDN